MLIDALSWYAQSISAFWVSLTRGGLVKMLMMWCFIYWIVCRPRRRGFRWRWRHHHRHHCCGSYGGHCGCHTGHGEHGAHCECTCGGCGCGAGEAEEAPEGEEAKDAEEAPATG